MFETWASPHHLNGRLRSLPISVPPWSLGSFLQALVSLERLSCSVLRLCSL